MTGRPASSFLPIAKIHELLQVEPMAVLIGLTLGAWVVYGLFLRGVSADRHRNLRRLFRNLFFHTGLACALFVAYFALTDTASTANGSQALTIFSAYVGLLVLLAWATVFVKASRIYLFEYLFISHMRVAVPLLLVNLFTLLLSVVIGGWLATTLFDIRLAPVLATSAIFSIVLGLAMQDTLGNLFAGVALQLDKPYEIGHWIEIHSSGEKWIGRVEEISWRATVLIAFSEELITIPNRVIAQSQISNYSIQNRPVIRSQLFRLPFDVPRSQVKSLLKKAAAGVPGVCESPEPLVLITENTENWLSFKLIYFVTDFGGQYVIGDEITDRVLSTLQSSKIALASARIAVLRDHA